MATLARVYLWTGRANGDDSYFARGLYLANRAAIISPLSSRAALAQLATQYQIGQTDTSIASGRRGIALNPENADLRSKLALAIYLSGQWSEGIALFAPHGVGEVVEFSAVTASCPVGELLGDVLIVA